MSDIDSDQEGGASGKRPRIYKDKQGNRYVKKGKKRITAPSGITDAAFLKWLIKYLRPKRKPRTARARKETAQPIRDPYALTSEQAADPSVRNYVNIERVRAGLEELDEPVAPGAPPSASVATQLRRAADTEEKLDKLPPEEKAKLLTPAQKRAITMAKNKAEKAAKAAADKKEEDEKGTLAETIKAKDDVKDTIAKGMSIKGLDVTRIPARSREYGHLAMAIDDAKATDSEKFVLKKLPDTQQFIWLLGKNSKWANIEYNKMIGKGGDVDGGMTTTQINDQMEVYRPRYLGCIARNEWGILSTPPRSGKSGWIMNTDANTKPGQHWVAFLMDLDGHTIEYYDSFAGKIPNDILDDLKKFIAKNNPTPEYLKLKENRIIDQDANSDNCGWFCIKFLRDRFRGNSFREVTKFDDHVKGERGIEEFKKQNGGSFDTYI